MCGIRLSGRSLISLSAPPLPLVADGILPEMFPTKQIGPIRHLHLNTPMQINQQPREKRTEHPHIQVHSVWETIQGEGPFAGSPAVFVRLSGCNLDCPLCDTDYTSTRDSYPYVELVRRIQLVRGSGLVVLTGGEPFRQNIGSLCRSLIGVGYTVQIETNGTLFVPDLPYESDKLVIVCSPKTPLIDKALAPHIDALKYVVQAGYVDAQDGLPTKVLGYPCDAARPTGVLQGVQIYIQPADEQDEVLNKKNLDVAVSVCMKFGYRFCLQVHKIIGMP